MTGLIAALLVAAVFASSEYSARVIRVIDGDTIAMTIAIWPNITAETSIRLRGVDTPELRGKCDDERRLAREAKVFVEKLLPKQSLVTLKNLSPDKYSGRHDADVILADGQSVAILLINGGMARGYDGGARKGWCGSP